MSRELDAAVASAHEMTKAPVVKPKPKSQKPVVKAAPKVSEKVGAPAVKVDKSGGRVRLRLLDHALEGCISTRDHGEIRYRLEPNKWTHVPEEVYILLRDKFYRPKEREVTDWNGDVNNPVKQTRMEVQNDEYVIEFPDEHD